MDAPMNHTSGSASASSSLQAAMDGWFATAFADGTRELTSLLVPITTTTVDGTTHAPCTSGVWILTKSSAVAVNRACPGEWSAISCACVDAAHANSNTTTAGFPQSDEWLLRVSLAPTTPTTTTVPTTVDASESVVDVTTIGQFTLPSHVTTFRLLGVSTTGSPLDFELDLTSPIAQEGTVALVLSQSKNYVKEVEIAYINLANVAIADTFLPPSVAHVTLRNCAIDTLPSPFLFVRWNQLVSIDLSGNKLSTWYPYGSAVAETPLPETGCTITTLNLARNAFTSIPSTLVAMDVLQSLNFSYNPVTNFTISHALYDRLVSLETLYFDGINTSSVTEQSCRATSTGSTWQAAHGVSFCVVSTVATTDSAASSTDGLTASASATLTLVAVGGSNVIIGLLVALLVVQMKRRRPNTRDKAFSRTFDDHASRSDRSDHSGVDSIHAAASARPLTIDHRLLNDPMVLTSRLDRTDLRIGQLLKQGGFGVVYSGVYRRRRVAIKMLRSDFTRDATLVESFLKEIALMSSLTHPRVVEYVGCAWDSLQHLAMVTELMDRGDLRETLQHFKRRDASLTWASDKTRLALHIAEGLAYLHTLSPKVIHRDLKAKNVLVNSDLDAKLTDFGIAREGRFEQTHMTAGIGTSFWIAPEVLAGLRYDERADIYSFGIVLSEIDTDDYPYWNDQQSGDDDHGMTQQHVLLRQVLAGTLRPQFSRACPQMIRVLADKCLDGEPANRPSASEIVAFLAVVAHAPIDVRRKLLAFTTDTDRETTGN